jgi:hypothetical protein
VLADEVTQIATNRRIEGAFGSKIYYANFCTRNVKSMVKSCSGGWHNI